MAYIKEGSAKIHQAFGIEKNGDPDGAVVLLLEGCGDLVQGAKNDTDAKRQLAVRTKVAQYLQKAETIEKQLVDSHNKQMQDIQNKTDAAIAERAAAERQPRMPVTNSSILRPAPAPRAGAPPSTPLTAMQPTFVPEPANAGVPGVALPDAMNITQPAFVPSGGKPEASASLGGHPDLLSTHPATPTAPMPPASGTTQNNDVSPYPSLDLLQFDSPPPPSIVEGADAMRGVSGGFVAPPEGFFSPTGGPQEPQQPSAPVTSSPADAPALMTSQTPSTLPPPPYSSVPGANDLPVAFEQHDGPG
eukprot:m.124048 g.124048  ORF g.124048 m.124048 type:complete len:303 (+) comp17280_c1_seq16:524-1432(+)